MTEQQQRLRDTIADGVISSVQLALSFDITETEARELVERAIKEYPALKEKYRAEAQSEP